MQYTQHTGGSSIESAQSGNSGVVTEFIMPINNHPTCPLTLPPPASVLLALAPMGVEGATA